MKNLIIFVGFFIIHLGITAQVTATVEVDNFDGSKKITTERWTGFGENNLRNTISASMLSLNDGIIGLHLSYRGDLGCFSERRSKLLVKLTNDEIIEFTQITRTDCSNTPSAIFWPLTSDELKLTVEEIEDIVKDNLELLKNHDWETIRLHGSRYYTDINPKSSRRISNPEQFFRQHISAIQEKME